MKTMLTTILIAAAFLAATAKAAPSVPPEVAVTDGSKPYLTALGIGRQIYECKDGAWTLRAPQAVLVDKHGNQIGTHYGGPTWELRDGGKITARRDAGVRVEATSIDWLRLAVTSSTTGRLRNTKWIQRINTEGGLAPAGACSAGDVFEVPYTADYVFWR